MLPSRMLPNDLLSLFHSSCSDGCVVFLYPDASTSRAASHRPDPSCSPCPGLHWDLWDLPVALVGRLSPSPAHFCPFSCPCPHSGDCLLSFQLLQAFPWVASESVLATGKVATVKRLIRETSMKIW